MTDEPNHVTARSLWCQLISGIELSDKEMSDLQNLLAADRELRQELNTDATIHASLLSMNDVRQSEDDFVRSVMALCSGENSGLETKTAQLLSDVSPQPMPPTLPSASHRVVSSRKRRSLISLRALSVTGILFVVAGLSIWWTVRESSLQVNGDLQAGKNGGVDRARQLETNLQEKNPEFRSDSPIAELPESKVVVAEWPSESVSPGEQIPDGAVPKTVNLVRNEPNESRIGNLPDGTFVTLTKVNNPVWERQWSTGDRLGSEVIRLFGGQLELTFDDGATVSLEGPTEFRPMTSGRLQLRRGKLMAAVPRQAIGFTVSTPTSEVVDLGTEFEISVKETGASDVVVKRGEIEVMPAGVKSPDRRKWRLVPEGLNQASFFERAEDTDTSPVSAAIRGNGGLFHGMISINGQTAEFSSAEAFDDVREHVLQQFENSQHEALLQWTEFVKAMHRNVQGTMQLNGAEIPFGNFDDVMKLQQQMLQRMRIPGGDPVNLTESSFTGSIRINGKVIHFQSREEYEEARRAAFGAAANFGAGDVLKRRARAKQQ
jgi:hypothetical protein